MVASTDFSSMRQAHLDWKLRLAEFLKTGTGLTAEEVTSARDCKLGKWLYNEGLERYKHLPEMRELEKIHARMHGYIADTVRFKNEGDDEQAYHQYDAMVDGSKQVVNLLDKLSEMMKSQHTRINVSAKQPPKQPLKQKAVASKSSNVATPPAKTSRQQVVQEDNDDFWETF
jgi:hypothetical protein